MLKAAVHGSILACSVGSALGLDTLVPMGSAWRYHYDWNGLPAAVREVAYDDSTWPQGLAQLGYGEQDEVTQIVPYPPNKPPGYLGDKPITAYFRHTFLATAAAVSVMRIRLIRDDGALIFINGQEVLRNNLPSGEILPSTVAERSLGGPEETGAIDLYVQNPPILPGANSIVVEIHQATSTSNDISFDLGLEVWTGPADADEDGLPDWWEDDVFHDSSASADGDADADGQSNRDEYLAGTDPLDPSSSFRCSLIHDVSSVFVQWQAVAGFRYTVWKSVALSQWENVYEATAEGDTFMGYGEIANAPPTAFFRVEAARFSPETPSAAPGK